jgi:hypothetical protein
MVVENTPGRETTHGGYLPLETDTIIDLRNKHEVKSWLTVAFRPHLGLPANDGLVAAPALCTTKMVLPRLMADS